MYNNQWNIDVIEKEEKKRRRKNPLRWDERDTNACCEHWLGKLEYKNKILCPERINRKTILFYQFTFSWDFVE